MNMPITIEIVDGGTDSVTGIEKAFDYFKYVENKFSIFKSDSEISKINRSELKESDWSEDMREIMKLSEETKKQTDGFFDIVDRQGLLNPSGLVKGWAIRNAAKVLHDLGFKNYFVDAGGDIQVQGKNAHRKNWSVGIRHPFNQNEIIKAVELRDQGIATSGTYIRGQHIYNPKNKDKFITDIVSLTVIGPDVYEADRMATPAFAMGRNGIQFIESLPGFEGYMVDLNGIATMTTGFFNYVA